MTDSGCTCCGGGCGSGQGPAVVDVVDSTGRCGPELVGWLGSRMGEACRELGVSGEVRIRVVADAVMSDLHATHSGIPGTTDVLTFDLRDLGVGPMDLDLVVCLDEAERQSGQRGHEPAKELLLYAVHGLLHCLGHDDHSEEAALRMHRAEDAVLSAIGVGVVYARPVAGGEA